jgi:hypothetical protein
MSQELAVQKHGGPQNGMVTTAISRQGQEVQAAIVIAKNYPRDEQAARQRIMETCKRPALADVAIYTYPRGTTKVEGPSIRLAEAIAQNWGNIDFGVVELEQRDGESTVLAYAWDLQSNVRQAKTFTIPHVRDTKQGRKEVRDARDVYEIVSNNAARRLRACILGVMPGDVVEDAVAVCNATMKANTGNISSEKLTAMIESFMEYGVSLEMLEARLKHKIQACNASEVVQLRKVYQSLKDGMGKPEDFFEAAAQQERVKQSAAAVRGAAVAKAKELGIAVTDDMALNEVNDLIMAALDEMQAKAEAEMEPATATEPDEKPKATTTTQRRAATTGKAKQQSFA